MTTKTVATNSTGQLLLLPTATRAIRAVTILYMGFALQQAPGHTDTAMGCKRPLDWPNPMCFLAPSAAGGCIKWVHDPVPQTCEGPSSYFRCFDYTVNGTLAVYVHAGTKASDCACSSSGWEFQGSGSSQIHRAYNNDTQCY